MHNYTGKHSAGIVIAATLFILSLLLALVLLSIRGGQRNTIQLPEDMTVTDGDMALSDVTEPFLQLDTDNIRDALGTLSRSTAYYQVLSVNTLWEQQTATDTIQLWRSGSCLRAQISGDGSVKHLMTDGASIWLWYDGETPTRSLVLDETVSFDDLLGVPTYETLLTLPEEDILDAGFVTFGNEETEAHDCLYIAARDGIYETRYWVDVDAQLLYRADRLDNESPIYQLRQSSCQILSADDATLQDVFRLPDGTSILPTEG